MSLASGLPATKREAELDHRAAWPPSPRLPERPAGWTWAVLTPSSLRRPTGTSGSQAAHLLPVAQMPHALGVHTQFPLPVTPSSVCTSSEEPSRVPLPRRSLSPGLSSRQWLPAGWVRVTGGSLPALSRTLFRVADDSKRQRMVRGCCQCGASGWCSSHSSEVGLVPGPTKAALSKP